MNRDVESPQSPVDQDEGVMEEDERPEDEEDVEYVLVDEVGDYNL